MRAEGGDTIGSLPCSRAKVKCQGSARFSVEGRQVKLVPPCGPFRPAFGFGAIDGIECGWCCFAPHLMTGGGRFVVGMPAGWVVAVMRYPSLSSPLGL